MINIVSILLFLCVVDNDNTRSRQTHSKARFISLSPHSGVDDGEPVNWEEFVDITLSNDIGCQPHPMKCHWHFPNLLIWCPLFMPLT